MKLRWILTKPPVALLLALVLSTAASAWANESDHEDEDENSDVEVVVVTGQRASSDGHSTGGGTGHSGPPSIVPSDYDHYGSVRCPMTPDEATSSPVAVVRPAG